MKTKKCLNKSKKVVSLKKRNNLVGFKKTKRRTSKKTAKRMRGGAVGNVIVFSKKNLKEEGEIGKYIKYVYTLPTSALTEKKLSKLMVNLKSKLKEEVSSFILFIQNEDEEMYIIASTVELKGLIDKTDRNVFEKTRQNKTNFIKHLRDIDDKFSWNKYLNEKDKKKYEIKPIVSPEPVGGVIPERPAGSAYANAIRANKKISEIVRNRFERGEKIETYLLKDLFNVTFGREYKLEFEILEKGMRSLASVATYNNKLSKVFKNESEIGDKHMWILLNQKLNEFGKFREKGFQISKFTSKYIYDYKEKKNRLVLFFEYSGELPDGITPSEIEQKGIKIPVIVVKNEDIISSLTRLYTYYTRYIDYIKLKGEKTAKRIEANRRGEKYEEQDINIIKSPNEDDEDLLGVYNIKINEVFNSLENFLLSEATMLDKNVLMNYIGFQSLRKELRIVRINSITLCFNLTNKDDILKYFNKTGSKGLFSKIEELNRTNRNISIVNRPYIDVLDNTRNKGEPPTLFTTFTKPRYSYSALSMYMLDGKNRVFDYDNLEIQKLLEYLTKVEYQICINIESNPKPYLKFNVQNERYKTFLSQLNDRYSHLMTKDSSKKLTNYIGLNLENSGFIQDIENIKKMIKRLVSQYNKLKSEETPEDLRLEELKIFDEYLKEIERLNKILTEYYSQLKSNKKREDYTIDLNFYDNFIAIIEKMLIIVGDSKEENPYTILNAKLDFHIINLQGKIKEKFSEELLDELISLEKETSEFEKIRERLLELLEDYTNIKERVEKLPNYEELKSSRSFYPTELKFKEFAITKL